ncbi:hypothetical protein ACIBL3_33065 [Kribbella sp. NPDC050124]|uniref:hypothetical protein n=1 Tax=Kribbella sp. NPDC050124 TaxID=3364114 RepID=UPI00378B355C
MPAKPIPGLGLVIGVVIGYATMVGTSYASSKLAMLRGGMLDQDLGRSLPWLVLLLGTAVVAAVLMAVPTIGSGVMTGAGAFMTLFGLAFLLLPLRQAFDLVKVFEVPGTRRLIPYMMLDGTFLFLGIVVLLVGVRRWASDAKVHRLLTAQGRAQDRAYGSVYPAQQQQWGGYPGQQQQPYPAQQQQPYPAQQPQHGQTFPAQQPPQHYGQQPPGGHPGQQQPPR